MAPKDQTNEIAKPKQRKKNVQPVMPVQPRRPTFAPEAVDVLPVFPDLPGVIPPFQPGDEKKWCTRNKVLIHKAVFEYSIDGTKIDPPISAVADFPLQKFSLVRVIPAAPPLPDWSAIVYEETRYQKVSDTRKDWVTTRVAGWVWNGFLEEYREEFPSARTVKIAHQTRYTADGEQVMIVPVKNKKTNEFDVFDEFSGQKFNMCGELSIAYVLHKDIETVIRTWRENSFAVYDKMIGEKNDEPLGQFEMDDIFRLFKDEVNFKYYVPDPAKEPGRTKVPLASADDPRRASDEFQNWLRDYYLITNLRIDTHTGELVRKGDEDRNHWVVVERVTHDGRRVELYNPFPNKRQAYSFGEFYNSVGGLPNRGWWVERRPDDRLAGGEHKERTPQTEDWGVAIDNQTPSTDDAEQYIYVEGESTKKNMLCGEFSVGFILTQSMETSLKNWLKAKEQEKPKLSELARMLQAYGFNNRKYVVSNTIKTKDPKTGQVISTVGQTIKHDLESDEPYFKSFSIDTILKYWKSVQPVLYRSILSDGNDTGTGPEDLKTILTAYGYKDREELTYYVPPPGERLLPPGRDEQKLKTHFLIASVLIETLHGYLIRWDPLVMGNRKPKDTAFHWVVVTKITPVGSPSGGSGGWVELYNPFSNMLEEYSYKEFWNSTTGPGMWVKRDITPRFTSQAPASARTGSADAAITAPAKTWTLDRLLGEVQKMRKNGKRDQQIPQLIFGKGSGGWSKDEIAGVVARTSTDPRMAAVPQRDGFGQKLKDKFKLKDAPPEDIVSLLRKTSEGDAEFLFDVVKTLRETGLLALEAGPVLSFREPSASSVRRSAVTDPRDGVSELQSRASTLIDRLADVVEPMFVAGVLETMKSIREAAALEEQKKKEAEESRKNLPMAVTSVPSYRVKWDWEHVEREHRYNCPDVYRLGQKENTNSGHYVVLTREWQFFWFDLCCKVVYGCYHDELTDERRERLAHKWTGVGAQTTAFTNYNGLDRWRNYVLNERMTKREPKIYTLVCGGASLAGVVTSVMRGTKKVPLLKVEHFDGRRPPPPVETIDPYTDPRVFFATIITDNKADPAGYDVEDAFAVIPFPQFEGMPVPVPIVATEDIYFPMKNLVPITDGKKANPYFPPRKIVIP